ncbi:MAG: 8-amino-7-oxononanoate synthase [Immundisolibacteraceae bacterium]|nr:8-amino-7-oxononanoate synthase [Immundisolibacteraceae bacterium]
MTGLVDRLDQRLEDYRNQGLYRQRVISAGTGQLVFNSNDYLGLANHPKLKKTLADAVNRYGAGSGGSHLVCGHHHQHHSLEQELAEFVGRDRALLFSSGYMANIGVMQTLLGRHDTVVGDRLNHASLIDAVKICSANHRRYRHGDLAAATRAVAEVESGQVLIATDGVFSMDGDIAPLPELAALAAQTGATLMVDDAHGFGVLGDSGAGSLQAVGLTQSEVPVLMATLGKAAGLQGAFVAGSETLIEGLIQFARTSIYTTALPASTAAGLRTSLHLIRDESWRRDKLQTNIDYFRRGAEQLEVELLNSSTPIQGMVAGSNQRVMTWSDQLVMAGIAVTAIRSPTVPAGSERLRITLQADHSEQQIDQLLESLALLKCPIDSTDRAVIDE